MTAVMALHPRTTKTFRLPVADRGRLMDPREIAQELFFGKVRPRWIGETVPRELRVPMGKGYFYWENEMRAWIASLRETP